MSSRPCGGPSIVDFGSYHYRYESGREGDISLVGFLPRKQAITLYFTTGFDAYGDLLGKLGKYKTGKGRLYIKRTENVDLGVLCELVRQSVKHGREKTHKFLRGWDSRVRRPCANKIGKGINVECTLNF